MERLRRHIQLYQYQQEIRKYLKENNLTAFVGNGSILFHLQKEYTANCKTEYVKKQIIPAFVENPVIMPQKSCGWTKKKPFTIREEKDFFYSECVKIENARYIRIDSYMSDISRLTAIISAEQINSLTWLMENLLNFVLFPSI